jgi:LuxR family transcriptional regulator, quorum-sensing system regulator SolR
MSSGLLTDFSIRLDGNTPEEVFSAIAIVASKLGFEYCVHGVRMPIPITRPTTQFFSNYSLEWQMRYAEQGYLAIDPTVAQGMRSSEPFLWSDEFFSEVPAFWEDAKAHGIRQGWAKSTRDAEGIFSLLVLARSAPEISQKELEEKSTYMFGLVEESHQAMNQVITKFKLESKGVPLTARESEVLRWTADGKTSADIAQILNISERTVNFHVSQTIEKLGVNNKTSAAVKAAMLGLIW